ncbi:MAG TPA: GntR family transcriptional regulator [Ruminococcaceae bacterium]|jgi:GntR family transcriptional regulator|nr:GntR family transcriptional regulator [Oscillospiraceae bacterium]
MPRPLNSESQKPLYQQLIEEVKRKIKSGEFTQGDKIPSEPEFMKTYEVSRITVRKAIEELVTEGYLTKKQGKGTFVNKPKIKRKIENIMSFRNACLACNMEPGYKLIERKLIKPSSDEIDFLNHGSNEKIIYTKRILTADGDPIMLENNYFPLNGFEFMLNENLEGSLYTLLKNKGINPIHSESCTLELVSATAFTAKLLNVPAGEPLFYMIAHIKDSKNNPIHIGRQYIVGSRYLFNIP